jgi:hypothetical protein
VRLRITSTGGLARLSLSLTHTPTALYLYGSLGMPPWNVESFGFLFFLKRDAYPVMHL